MDNSNQDTRRWAWHIPRQPPSTPNRQAIAAMYGLSRSTSSETEELDVGHSVWLDCEGSTHQLTRNVPCGISATAVTDRERFPVLPSKQSWVMSSERSSSPPRKEDTISYPVRADWPPPDLAFGIDAEALPANANSAERPMMGSEAPVDEGWSRPSSVAHHKHVPAKANPGPSATRADLGKGLDKTRSHKWHSPVDQYPRCTQCKKVDPRARATITYSNNDGVMETLSNINPAILGKRCPLLELAFEESRFGPTLHLEALTSITAKPFVRFLYTGSYALAGSSDPLYDDVPTSLLLHCQLYHLGDIYDLVELKQQAYFNVTRQCEFGCSSPDMPIDLCAAIEFAYDQLSDHANLIETIVCYCVTCFLRHDLEGNADFRTLAYGLRPFHQDLCKESRKRGFEDDTATAIIRMPFKPYSPETYASREDIDISHMGDVIYQFHGGDEPRRVVHSSQTLGSVNKSIETTAKDLTLVLRNRPLPEQTECAATSSTLGSNVETDSDTTSGGALARSDAMQNAERGSNVETDFEFVSGPRCSQPSSDSESDEDNFVHVDKQAVPVAGKRSLPIRQSRSQGSAIVEYDEEQGGSGSDTDWSLL